MCPHCGAVLAECHKDFELNYNHSFEGTLYRLGFTYDTVDWLSNDRFVECLECGNNTDVIKLVDSAFKK